MPKSDYSTTRSLVHERPACFDSFQNGLETLLKLPDQGQKTVEGGLRLQGLFKVDSIDKPLLSVVTVVYNGVAFLEDTIKSVLGQIYDNVEYIIIDGGSNDGTLDIIKKYEHAIDYWVSEPDKGMYDALVKGFSCVSGSIMSYLNAGDLYVATALGAVALIFKEQDCEWVTGMMSTCNEANQVIHVSIPFRYKADFIKKGVYGKYLPYIQQESTFWRKDLLCSLDMEFFKSLRYAGDCYIWFCFAMLAELKIAQVQLGIFKIHEGQLSENQDKYRLEVKSFAKKLNPLDFLKILFESFPWLLSDKSRKFFNPSRLCL